MPTPTMRDPKHMLDEAIDKIDKVFARNGAAQETVTGAKHPVVELPPMLRQRLGLTGWVVAASAALSVLAATFITLLVTRRRTPAPKTRLLFGKPTRHFGYGRYHLGRFGTAYLAYTYKLPQVRYHVPSITYKLPSIHVKLPAVHC